MYCAKCGFENPDEARFCGKCAALMPRVPGAPAPAGYGPTPPLADANAVPSGLKLGIGISSVIIPLLGFIMGIIYMIDSNPAKKSAGKLWLLLGVAGMVMYCVFGMALSNSVH